MQILRAPLSCFRRRWTVKLPTETTGITCAALGHTGTSRFCTVATILFCSCIQWISSLFASIWNSLCAAFDHGIRFSSSVLCFIEIKRSQSGSALVTLTVADLEGAEPAPYGREGDGLTPSLTVMLANAKFWSFYCKKWYSEYSKWLPAVAFWQL